MRKIIILLISVAYVNAFSASFEDVAKSERLSKAQFNFGQCLADNGMDVFEAVGLSKKGYYYILKEYDNRTVTLAKYCRNKTKISEPNLDSKSHALGKKLYSKCAGCHGANGEKSALGKSAIIAGQDAAITVEQLNLYKAGTLNRYGMGGLMKGQAATMSDYDMESIANYISSL